MKMADTEIGATYFMNERFGDEWRETYYERTAAGVKLLGFAQGVHGESPRVRRLSKTPTEYALIPALILKPIADAEWFALIPALESFRAGEDVGVTVKVDR